MQCSNERLTKDGSSHPGCLRSACQLPPNRSRGAASDSRVRSHAPSSTARPPARNLRGCNATRGPSPQSGFATSGRTPGRARSGSRPARRWRTVLAGRFRPSMSSRARKLRLPAVQLANRTKARRTTGREPTLITTVKTASFSGAVRQRCLSRKKQWLGAASVMRGGGVSSFGTAVVADSWFRGSAMRAASAASGEFPRRGVQIRSECKIGANQPDRFRKPLHPALTPGPGLMHGYSPALTIYTQGRHARSFATDPQFGTICILDLKG